MGVVCIVDMMKRDSEIKVLLGCTQAEMRRIQCVHSSGGQSAILIERDFQAQ